MNEDLPIAKNNAAYATSSVLQEAVRQPMTAATQEDEHDHTGEWPTSLATADRKAATQSRSASVPLTRIRCK